MERAAQGEWLLQMPYTPEPHAQTLIYVFYVLLGKIAALTSLSTAMTYHGARVLFGLGLLLTVYRFLAEFTQRLAVRRLAWLMTTFGGGLGWLLVALGQSNWLGSPPLDFYLPEGFAFLVLLGFPHIAAAQSLLLWGTPVSAERRGENPHYVIRYTHHAPRFTHHVSHITFHVLRFTFHVPHLPNARQWLASSGS